MGRKREKVPGWNAFVALTDDEVAAAKAENKHPTMVLDVEDKAYHNHDSVSKTQLNAFLESSEVYFRQYVERSMPFKKPSKQMNLGVVVHAALLEAKPLEDLVAVIPASCYTNGDTPRLNSRGQAWQDFANENVGKVFVKSEELDAIGDCMSAVMKSELYDCIQQATGRERAIFWNDVATGMDCRCKPDFFVELDKSVVCYDLKVSPAISPGAFRMQAKRFRYWLQDAHYSEGLTALCGKPVTFRFWVVEPVQPYRVKCYWFDEASTRDKSMQKRAAAMERLKRCYETGNWTDGWNGVVVLNEWDFGDVDSSSELEGFDD